MLFKICITKNLLYLDKILISRKTSERDIYKEGEIEIVKNFR